jgi:hypothetical protein
MIWWEKPWCLSFSLHDNQSLEKDFHFFHGGAPPSQRHKNQEI